MQSQCHNFSLRHCCALCLAIDVSRYAGHLEHVFETTIAGVMIQAPQLDISTVAAGGGSQLTFRSGAVPSATVCFLAL